MTIMLTIIRTMQYKNTNNLDGCNSTGQVLNLLSISHQFEYHKSQSH